MAKPPPYQVVAGNDEFLVNRRGQELWTTLSDGITDEFALEIVEGQAGTVAEVEQAVDRFTSAVRTLPMFGDRKCVWFRTLTFFADSVTGRAEGTQAKIAQLLEVLAGINPDEVGVLVTISPVDRRKTAYKKLQATRNLEWIDPKQQEGALATLVLEEAERLGVTFTDEAANLLLALVGTQPRLAIEETRKVATWLGEEATPITPAMVTDLVPPYGEGDFFEAVEAFFSGDLEWTLAALRRHFFAGHDMRPLIYNFQNRNRLLIQIRVLMDAGALSARISKGNLENALNQYGRHFGPDAEKSAFNVFSQNPWYLGRLAESARKHSVRQLIDYQVAFIKAFQDCTARPAEAEAILRATAISSLGQSLAQKA